MTRKKVLITPRSFGMGSKAPLDLLLQNGCEIILNPFGRILTKDEMISLIQDVDGVIVGVDSMDEEVLRHASKLKVISKYGVGTDNIDVSYASERGIPVAVSAGANKEAVADYAFALMLGAARRITRIDRECRSLNWTKITTIDVWQKTLGLIGLGNIGKGVAQRASGFEMKVLAYDLVEDREYAKNYGIQYVPLETIYEKADFISIHLPLNEQTRHMISYPQIQRMKNTAVIVNTARGGLIDEEALYDALKEQKIWGAGIDVFEQEPPVNRKLLELDNLLIGSHSAASTFAAIDNMGLVASANLIKHLE